MTEFLTSAEAAAALSLEESWLRRLAKRRGIGRKFGRDWMFTRADIETIRPTLQGHVGRPPGSKNRE